MEIVKIFTSSLCASSVNYKVVHTDEHKQTYKPSVHLYYKKYMLLSISTYQDQDRIRR